MDQQNEFNLNSGNLIMLVWEKRRLFILVSCVAFVVSLVASFLITPLFNATAIIYPPVATQQSKEIFTTGSQRGLTVFGEDEEAEQLLQVLSSSTLRDIVVGKLGLMQKWGINPDDKYARHKVSEIYNGYVSFRPTQYQSVEIEVMEASPQMAATIANTIVDVSDSLMRSIKAQVAQKALLALEKQYQIALMERQEMIDTLKEINQLGVIHLSTQTDEFYKAYAKAVAGNNQSAITALEKKIEPLKIYGSKYNTIIEEIHFMSSQIVDLSGSIKVLKVEASCEIPSHFVVDRATVPDKKAYPKKSIIVIVSTLSALFFTFFLVVILGFVRQTVKQ